MAADKAQTTRPRRAGRPGRRPVVATYLNAGLLRTLWPALHLPHGTRKAWETAHPELRAMRPSAA
jgi:hypothetical protein